jgi:hypothetical protein
MMSWQGGARPDVEGPRTWGGHGLLVCGSGAVGPAVGYRDLFYGVLAGEFFIFLIFFMCLMEKLLEGNMFSVIVSLSRLFNIMSSTTSLPSKMMLTQPVR